jgi:hypothetical protein
LGYGWTKARDLVPGDIVRTLAGTLRVTSVSDDRKQPVFNLQVAEAASFFMGKGGMLVHDNSVVYPALEPFDAPPTLAAVAPEVR